MRTPIMAGNWKMHHTSAEARALASAVVDGVATLDGVEVVLCPSFTTIPAVAQAVAGSAVQVGAQNMYWAEQGAFTGEVSPLMLKEFCQYVILGHSERRQYFGEMDEGINQKAKAALAHGLTPIICCGEDLAQNEANETVTVVGTQIRQALAGLTLEQVSQVVIAYEPIWAIGTGRAAEPEAVNDIIKVSIREVIADLYAPTIAEAVRVQYGGSVKLSNIDRFMTQPDIDGGLVGGASLKAETFVPLVQSAAKLKVSPNSSNN